jgi:hypothetical protein
LNPKFPVSILGIQLAEFVACVDRILALEPLGNIALLRQAGQGENFHTRDFATEGCSDLSSKLAALVVIVFQNRDVLARLKEFHNSGRQEVTPPEVVAASPNARTLSQSFSPSVK